MDVTGRAGRAQPGLHRRRERFHRWGLAGAIYELVRPTRSASVASGNDHRQHSDGKKDAKKAVLHNPQLSGTQELV
jgi:hypothetical protein